MDFIAQMIEDNKDDPEFIRGYNEMKQALTEGRVKFEIEPFIVGERHACSSNKEVGAEVRKEEQDNGEDSA